MKAKIKVTFQNKQKKEKIPAGIRILLRRVCSAVIEEEGLDDICEVSVSFVDNGEIRKLNAIHRNKSNVTDVLSFPLGENGIYDKNPETGALMLGDVVISIEKAISQANDFGHSFNREICYLTAHSMFHLLGYDHEAGGLDAVKMREKEEAVMLKVGYPRGTSYTFSDQ